MEDGRKKSAGRGKTRELRVFLFGAQFHTVLVLKNLKHSK
jgi:hypothetical protein